MTKFNYTARQWGYAIVPRLLGQETHIKKRR